MSAFKYKVIYSNKFIKQIDKLVKNGLDIKLVNNIVSKLANGERLDLKYKDHNLIGNFKDYRECHIKPDLLLVYKIEDDILVLQCVQIGSHSEIFKK